jgi:hypothetical protein
MILYGGSICQLRMAAGCEGHTGCVWSRTGTSSTSVSTAPERFSPGRTGISISSYVGRGGPDMIAALRALFESIRLGRQSAPELYKRVRMHFVEQPTRLKPKVYTRSCP